MPSDPPMRSSGPPPTAPSRIHVAGRGLAVDAGELPLEVRQVDADLVDLTPADPMVLARGAVELRLRQATVAVSAERLATFLRGEIHASALRGFELTFHEPDIAVVTAEAKIDGRFTPVRLTGRLVATGGKLGFQPTALQSTVKGFALRWRPQAQRVELEATDEQLMNLLLPKLQSKTIADVRWHLTPGEKVVADAGLMLSGKRGELHLVAGLAPTVDGKLAIAAQTARLSWRGLEFQATPPTQEARLTGTQGAIQAIIEEELDTDRLKLASLRLLPGNRFEGDGMLLESGEYRPIHLAGRLSAKDGGLYVAPESVSIKGAKGGIDVVFAPQTGKTEGSITEGTLNELLGPLAAKEHFEGLGIKLLAGNRFTLEGDKVDPKNGHRKHVKIEGQLRLTDDDGIRFDFKKIKYGGLTVDFGQLHVKILQAFGLHLDDLLKIDEPFAQMRKDSLFFYPGRLTDRISGHLEALEVKDGVLSVRADVDTDLRELIPLKAPRFGFDGKGLLIRPAAVTERAAGTITGVSTGAGTFAIDARLTPEDLRHVVGLHEDKIEFLGDRIVLDPDKLQDVLPGAVKGVTTASGRATVQLGVNASDAADLVPSLPRGLAFNGKTVTAPIEAIDPALHGAITGVRVQDGQVVVQVGEPGEAKGGNRVGAALTGTLVVSGITVEDAEAELADRTPDTPLDPRRLQDGQLSVVRGRAFVPRARVEAMLSEQLAKRDLKGFSVSYAPGGLSVAGKWGIVPLSGRVKVEGGGDGLALRAESVKVWGVPLPAWAATWLAGRLAKLPTRDGKLLLDVGRLSGVKFGPIRQVEAGTDGLRLRIGD